MNVIGQASLFPEKFNHSSLRELAHLTLIYVNIHFNGFHQGKVDVEEPKERNNKYDQWTNELN
jgi:hypothetical protein